MNKYVKNFRTSFVRKHIYDKSYVDKQDKDKMKDDIYEELNGFEAKYYEKVPQDVSDEDLDLYIRIRTLEKIEEMTKKQETIKTLLVICTFILVIGFIKALIVG